MAFHSPIIHTQKFSHIGMRSLGFVVPLCPALMRTRIYRYIVGPHVCNYNPPHSIETENQYKTIAGSKASMAYIKYKPIAS